MRYLFSLLVAGLSFSSSAKAIADTTLPLPAMNKELSKAWTAFANAAIVGDYATLKKLSASCVFCTDCVDNTPAEDSLFAIYQEKHPDTWYEKLYTEFSFIPIDRLIKEDLGMIFTPLTNARLLDPSKLKWHEDGINKKLYSKPCTTGNASPANLVFREILVTVVDPSKETEGFQKAFMFVKTKQGYRFCGYSTIP